MTARLAFARAACTRLACALTACALLAAAGAASAQGRDPMQPPAAARSSAAGAAAGPAAPGAPLVARHLLVVDGQRYLIDRGRRLGVGDTLGDARIERIDDNAVLVRRNGQTERLPLFAGVTKRASADVPAADASARPTLALSPRVQRPGEPR